LTPEKAALTLSLGEPQTWSWGFKEVKHQLSLLAILTMIAWLANLAGLVSRSTTSEDGRQYIKVHNVIAGWVLIYGSECWTSTKQVARERQQDTA
jgi:hypothetical protein